MGFAHESAELSESILRATPIQFWPDGEEPDRKYSHAWFVAFIQPKGAAGLPDWHAPARIAIAVLLEFGGSGGGTSGPLCRDVAELIINDFPHYVDAHARLALRQP